MKILRYSIQAIFFLFLLNSCGEPVKLVLGDWQWVESVGGLLPTQTPESTGKSASLTIARDQWTYFENGGQVERYKINIKRRAQGLIIESERSNDDKIIEFINDDEITISFYGGPNTDCQDCLVSRYIRINND